MNLTNAPTNPNKDRDYINQMYDAALESQKQGLQSAHDNNMNRLETQQQQAQQRTDANLNRTYVEAAKQAKNSAEMQAASGLSSGTVAQARLAQDNQLAADLTALRTQQQQADSDIERERTLLGKEYAAAIAKAQADNDMGRAQALYQAAKAEEARLRQQQAAAGNLMSKVGDFSIIAQLYGLTPEQVAALEAAYNSGKGGSSGGGGGGRGRGGRAPQTATDGLTGPGGGTGGRRTGGAVDLSGMYRPSYSLN